MLSISRRSLPPWACRRRKDLGREARAEDSTIADPRFRSGGKSGLPAVEDIERLAAAAADGASAVWPHPFPIRGAGDRDLVRRRRKPDAGANLPVIRHRPD